MKESRMNKIAKKLISKESRLDIVNRILDEKNAEKIDRVLIDLTTANMLKGVYNASKPDLQKKLDKLPIKKLVDFGWSLVR